MQMNGPSLKCQTKGMSPRAQNPVREGHRLPIEQAVDHVRPHPIERRAPIIGGQVLDMAEGLGAHPVEPAGRVGPQPEQRVAALGEREHAFGVVSEFADQQDFQPIARPRVGFGAIRGEARALVDVEPGGAAEGERLAHLVALAIGVHPALGRADRLVALHRVIDPIGGDAPRFDRRAEPIPKHRVQIVGGELRALDPALGASAVHRLDELDRRAFDPARRLLVVMMPHAADREPRARCAVERGDQACQMAGEKLVVARQIGDEFAPRGVEPGVERGAQAPVARMAAHAQSRLGLGPGGEQRGCVVGRAVVDRDRFPIGEILRDEARQRAREESGLVKARHDHREARVSVAVSHVVPIGGARTFEAREGCRGAVG